MIEFFFLSSEDVYLSISWLVIEQEKIIHVVVVSCNVNSDDTLKLHISRSAVHSGVVRKFFIPQL